MSTTTAAGSSDGAAASPAGAGAGALAANSRHIALHAAKLPPRQQDVSTVTEAFGAWAYPKIVAGLRSDNAAIRNKSVVTARELLAPPERHVQCIAAGITPALRDLLLAPSSTPTIAAAAAAAGSSNADGSDRLLADVATTLRSLVAKEVGARDAIQHGCLPPLLQLLTQPSAAVRDAAYSAQQEDAPHRAVAALALLHRCTQARDAQDALMQLVVVQEAVPKLCAMLAGAPQDAVCLGVVQLLGALAALHASARTQAVEAGCVPELLARLAAEPPADLAAAAASVLMMVTLAKEGKVAVHQAGGLAVCLGVLAAQLQQLQDAGGGSSVLHEALAVNCLAVVINSAEYPPCAVALRQAPQPAAVSGLHRHAAAPATVVAAAGHVLRMASVKQELQGGGSSNSKTG